MDCLDGEKEKCAEFEAHLASAGRVGAAAWKGFLGLGDSSLEGGFGLVLYTHLELPEMPIFRNGDRINVTNI